jgi:hypothetical protein
VIEPDGMADDHGGEPMAIVGSGGLFIPQVSPASRPPARAGYRDHASLLLSNGQPPPR